MNDQKLIRARRKVSAWCDENALYATKTNHVTVGSRVKRNGVSGSKCRIDAGRDYMMHKSMKLVRINDAHHTFD